VVMPDGNTLSCSHAHGSREAAKTCADEVAQGATPAGWAET